MLAVGLLFLRLHTLPERMAHKSQKLQFEIVAVLGLLALFTHQHIFWVAGLLLAVIDLPDLYAATPHRWIGGENRRRAARRRLEGCRRCRSGLPSLPDNRHGRERINQNCSFARS